MHPLLRVPYTALGALAEFASAFAPGGDAKWQRALAGRRGLAARYRAFAPGRDAARPLVWFHAPSVGESLQALPVMQRFRTHAFEGQLAYTWFSPSAAAFAERFPADFRDYLGFDTGGAAEHELDALRPTALVYSKLDVWPTLTDRAAARGVRLGLISATLSASSGRRGAIARAALRDAYTRLDLVGAVSGDDAQLLTDLGVRSDAIRVTGDTRFDQVWERVRGPGASAGAVEAGDRDRPTLVAGSTWPSDEGPLTAAWDDVRRTATTARLVVAPHEPTERHLADLEAWAIRTGLSSRRLSDDAPWDADLVLIDRVGILAEVYAMADVAYVGGGFHDAGIHSVLEPAALGVPVVFGPGKKNSREARSLAAAGGGWMVEGGEDLSVRLIACLNNSEEGPKAGELAEAFVHANLGAADRNFELVCDLIGRAGFPTKGRPQKA